MFKSRKVDLSMNHSMQNIIMRPLLSGRLDFDITIAESILNCRRRLSGLVNLALRVVTVEDDAETVAITQLLPLYWIEFSRLLYPARLSCAIIMNSYCKALHNLQGDFFN